jgi:hypothetical protein
MVKGLHFTSLTDLYTVLRIRDVYSESRIQDFFPTRIPNLKSRIQHKKEKGKNESEIPQLNKPIQKVDINFKKYIIILNFLNRYRKSFE